ncbi:MAG: hypothetical protein ACJAQ4_000152 [Cryomorphaceae bacterium]|jgi:hypothetical protein
MSLLDVILTIFYFGICYGIGYAVLSRHPDNPLYKKWFIKGLSAKLWGGLAFALVYTFYYEYGGDTRSYFDDSTLVVQSLGDGLSVYWEVLNHHLDGTSFEAFNYISRMAFQDPREYYVVNIISIFNLLGFGSYFSVTLLVALFTYWGVWHFFLLMVHKFPEIEKQMAFAILFIPSVAFWGSGISKDSLILCGVGLLIYHVNQLASRGFWQLGSLIVVAVSAYFMFVVKAYVLISLVPAILLWRTLYLRERIKSGLLRTASLPIVAVLSVFAMVYSLDFIAKYNNSYTLDSFVDTAQSMQGWHYVEGDNSADEHGRGSSYTLGEYDASSWQGMLKVFPAAVNATFFRPYFWEINGAAMLAQAIESFLFLAFVLFTFLKVGPLKVYRYISNDSFLLMCVVFALFFGFAVGFSSYNFGALSRYKIPAVPFFIAALFIIRHKAKEAKSSSIQRVIRAREARIKQTQPGF